MFNIDEERYFPYNKSAIKQCILDVESYPNFIPWLKKVIVISKSADKMLVDCFINLPIDVQYRSEIEIDECHVRMRSTSDQLKCLTGCWSFLDHKPSGTLLKFQATLDFHSQLINKLCATYLKDYTFKITDLFSDRIHTVCKEHS
ncbi:putative type II toxin-antitoxin system RatA family toxin [Rickettsiales endosymbiont of Paramecium tredecaurelia]|uniref:type II toxin-antitoxin system RatA family toxin n=1 Tax=Candidatus Sarmatiella mevalonica TaxID=2770581 RepID=UPI0019245AD3|nr:SRPBCC family protein [Candidatus Sarmatiella mevalonica]MBL3284757.1 putative type II toxin-antitoxin system RatA family toxin [Candidatus Sarmatiella mevalonica]